MKFEFELTTYMLKCLSLRSNRWQGVTGVRKNRLDSISGVVTLNFISLDNEHERKLRVEYFGLSEQRFQTTHNTISLLNFLRFYRNLPLGLHGSESPERFRII